MHKHQRPKGTAALAISDEAVEAAAKAIDSSKAEGCGCCAFPEFTAEEDSRADMMGINVRALLIAREALEAAGPVIREEALEQAADTLAKLRPEMGPGININQYREGRDDAFATAARICRARAMTERASRG